MSLKRKLFLAYLTRSTTGRILLAAFLLALLAALYYFCLR